MDTLVLVIIVAFISLAIGFALGLSLGLWRSGQGSAPSAQQRLTEVARSSTPPSEAQASLSSPAAPPLKEAPVPPSAAVEQPRLNPLGVLARAVQPDVRPAQPPSKSIAAQIDEILQEKLKDSPLASRAIRLLELPNKGMVVMVGLDQYDGVEAVPDDDIRNLIRSAVVEWEKRVMGE